MLVRMWKNCNLHALLVTVKWCCHFGKYFEIFFFKVKYKCTGLPWWHSG